jgi:hypothetical protein
MGIGGPMAYLLCTKKKPNQQIGSGGAMRTGIRCLLELLLEVSPSPLDAYAIQTFKKWIRCGRGNQINQQSK